MRKAKVIKTRMATKKKVINRYKRMKERRKTKMVKKRMIRLKRRKSNEEESAENNSTRGFPRKNMKHHCWN